MNITPTLGALLVLAAFGTQANAQLTREQVKAELAEAIRSGDMPVGGESDLKLNQLYPGRYPAKAAVAGKTREQVKTELAEAIRTGDMPAGGESGQKLNELNPQRYPAKPVYAGKTREQVKAELADAIRTGDMPAGGESGLMLYEMYPERYAKAREAMYAKKPQAPMATATAASAPTYAR
jgi:ribosomal protein L30E